MVMKIMFICTDMYIFFRPNINRHANNDNPLKTMLYFCREHYFLSSRAAIGTQAATGALRLSSGLQIFCLQRCIDTGVVSKVLLYQDM